MPRLRRRRKERKSDFTRSLARFLADAARTIWIWGSQFIAIKPRGDREAYLKDHATGKLQVAVLRPHGRIAEINRALAERSPEAELTFQTLGEIERQIDAGQARHRRGEHEVLLKDRETGEV